MLITKILGCLLIILSSAAMGFYFSNEMKCRVEDLREFRKLTVLLRGDIRYGSTPLPEAINAIGRRHEGVFAPFFSEVGECLHELSGRTFQEIWRDAVQKGLTKTSLNKKDKQHLIWLGENLGYLDKEMQMNTLDLFITQMEEEIQELAKSVKEKAHLCKSLGVLAGIFISIVMI